MDQRCFRADMHGVPSQIHECGESETSSSAASTSRGDPAAEEPNVAAGLQPVKPKRSQEEEDFRDDAADFDTSSEDEHTVNERFVWERCTTSESIFNVGGGAHHANALPLWSNQMGDRSASSTKAWNPSGGMATMRDADAKRSGGNAIQYHTLTIMIKNLPRNITKQMLLDDLELAGFRDLYDFFYLPLSLVARSNRGHAFINFVSPGLAQNFKVIYDGRRIGNVTSKKTITVEAAMVQGFAANYAHHSAKLHSSGEGAVTSKALPLFLRSLRPGELEEAQVSSVEPPSPPLAVLPMLAKKEQLGIKAGGRLKAGGTHFPIRRPVYPEAATRSKPKVPQFCHQCGSSMPKCMTAGESEAKPLVWQFCHECGSKLPTMFENVALLAYQ